MSFETKYPIFLVVTILWLGFILSISFFESWLKFKVPGVNLQIGLSIGNKVFNTLNKIEICFALVLITHLFLYNKSFPIQLSILLILAVSILLIQTIWILPILDLRVQKYLNGEKPTDSLHHFYYIIGEIFKVLLLITLVFFQFKKIDL